MKNINYSLQMHLRQLKKVDYRALNSGEESESDLTMDNGQNEEVLDGAVDKNVDPNAKNDDSDSDASENTVVTPEELKELQEELAQLELQEKHMKLKKSVSEKKASIQLMKQEMKGKDHSSHTSMLPGYGKIPPCNSHYQYDDMKFGQGDKEHSNPPFSGYPYPCNPT